MRRFFAGAVILALLQGCAAETEQRQDRGKPVIQAYEDPLVRSSLIEKTEGGSDDGDLRTEGQERLDSLAPGDRPPAGSDEDGLWMKMDRLEEDLSTSGQLVDDPELVAYVRGLACKLARAHCPHVRVYVITQPGFNARMAPNGAMEIWTGALLRLRSEAELSALIGHELGHYLRRHSVQRLRATRNKVASFLEGHAGTGTARAGYRDLLGSLSGFGRSNEREADGYGLHVLAEAGYEPKAVSELWRRLNDEFETVEAYRNQSAFYATHPLMEERAEILAELAEDVRAKMAVEPVLGRDSYLAMIRPRRAAYLRDELDQRQFEQAEALLDGLLADDDPNPAELHYFKGEIHRLRDETGDLQKALDSYETAQKAAGEAPPELHRSRGLLLRRKGKGPAAAAALAAYLEAVPDAADRPLVKDLIAALARQ